MMKEKHEKKGRKERKDKEENIFYFENLKT